MFSPAPRRTAVRTPKQRAGDAAEDAAAKHLAAAGCRIVARNARYRDGEVDLVARERDVLVFVEVRMRVSLRFGGAAVSVNTLKQKRIARAALHVRDVGTMQTGVSDAFRTITSISGRWLSGSSSPSSAAVDPDVGREVAGPRAGSMSSRSMAVAQSSGYVMHFKCKWAAKVNDAGDSNDADS